MLKSEIRVRIGVAGFALGLSVAGPQALGVAAAESPDAPSAPAAASGQSGKSGAVRSTSARPARPAAEARPTPTAAQRITGPKPGVLRGQQPTVTPWNPWPIPGIKPITRAPGLPEVFAGALQLLRRNVFNTAPTVNPVQTAGQLDGPIEGSVGAVDPEGDPIVYSVVQAPIRGQVVIRPDGGYTYTPGPDFTGADVFTVAADDIGSDRNVLDINRPASTLANVTVQQGVEAAELLFKFSYGVGSKYWTQEAKKALEWSAEQLAGYLTVATPVTVEIAVSGGNVRYKRGENADGSESWESQCKGGMCSSSLANASSDYVSGESGFFPTIVQQKIISGIDANGSKPDGQITFNFGQKWAYGDKVADDRYDFKSTAIHEFLHTLGFTSNVNAAKKNDCGDDPCETYGNDGTTWGSFDQFISDADGKRAIDAKTFVWDSTFDPNITGAKGGLFFSGPNARKAYNDKLVPLFSPKPYSEGSSIAHLDDVTFKDTNSASINSKKMMNSSDNEGLGVRELSKIELAILKDMGYTIREKGSATA